MASRRRAAPPVAAPSASPDPAKGPAPAGPPAPPVPTGTLPNTGGNGGNAIQEIHQQVTAATTAATAATAPPPAPPPPAPPAPQVSPPATTSHEPSASAPQAPGAARSFAPDANGTIVLAGYELVEDYIADASYLKRLEQKVEAVKLDLRTTAEDVLARVAESVLPAVKRIRFLGKAGDAEVSVPDIDKTGSRLNLLGEAQQKALKQVGGLETVLPAILITEPDGTQRLAQTGDITETEETIVLHGIWVQWMRNHIRDWQAAAAVDAEKLTQIEERKVVRLKATAYNTLRRVLASITPDSAAAAAARALLSIGFKTLTVTPKPLAGK